MQITDELEDDWESSSDEDYEANKPSSDPLEEKQKFSPRSSKIIVSGTISELARVRNQILEEQRTTGCKLDVAREMTLRLKAERDAEALNNQEDSAGNRDNTGKVAAPDSQAEQRPTALKETSSIGRSSKDAAAEPVEQPEAKLENISSTDESSAPTDSKQQMDAMDTSDTDSGYSEWSSSSDGDYDYEGEAPAVDSDEEWYRKNRRSIKWTPYASLSEWVRRREEFMEEPVTRELGFDVDLEIGRRLKAERDAAALNDEGPAAESKQMKKARTESAAPASQAAEQQPVAMTEPRMLGVSSADAVSDPVEQPKAVLHSTSAEGSSAPSGRAQQVNKSDNKSIEWVSSDDDDDEAQSPSLDPDEEWARRNRRTCRKTPRAPGPVLLRLRKEILDELGDTEPDFDVVAEIGRRLRAQRGAAAVPIEQPGAVLHSTSAVEGSAPSDSTQQTNKMGDECVEWESVCSEDYDTDEADAPRSGTPDSDEEWRRENRGRCWRTPTAWNGPGSEHMRLRNEILAEPGSSDPDFVVAAEIGRRLRAAGDAASAPVEQPGAALQDISADESSAPVDSQQEDRHGTRATALPAASASGGNAGGAEHSESLNKGDHISSAVQKLQFKRSKQGDLAGDKV